MSCNICVEKYNKSTHLEIKCNYCEFSNCRTCFQKYILDTVDPYCMNCKKIFTKEFISENCTQVFIGKPGHTASSRSSFASAYRSYHESKA
jgi:hypothetical protein